MFTDAYLQKILEYHVSKPSLDAALAAIYKAHGITLKIAGGNAKMGHIPSFSVAPGGPDRGGTCAQTCYYGCHLCYAVQLARQYPSVRDAWAYNTKLVQTVSTDLFTTAFATLAELMHWHTFRWNVAGDIFPAYLDKILAVARALPTVQFYLYTKARDLVQDGAFIGKPRNLAALYSMTGLDPDPVAISAMRKWALAHGLDGLSIVVSDSANATCPGNCETCGNCFIGQDVAIKAHR